MSHRLIREVLADGAPGSEVSVSGWVRTRRDSKGGFSFLVVNDGSCFRDLQIIAGGDLENYAADILQLTTGASVAVTGILMVR